MFPKPLALGGLSADERRTWEEAVGYYDRELADRDLLFDRRLGAIRHWLAATPDDASPDGLTDDVRRVLEGAASVYRSHWWRAHDRANRAWIAATVDRTAQVLAPVSSRLAALYQTPWLADPARVDVVFVGNRQGAYTSDEVVPLITISSSDPQHVEWTSVELVFHETSHVLIERVQQAIARELERQHREARDLWHVALFWMTGQVMRDTLAARGVSYEPYLYSTTLLDRAWPQYKKAVEGSLPAYVAGQISLDELARRLVAGF
jgi:hypothetical protein